MRIDKSEIACRFKRSVESYEENAYAQKAIVSRFMTLLKTYCPTTSGRILEIGCGTGLLTTRICRQFKNNELYVNDLVEVMCNKTASRCQLTKQYCLSGDIEQIALEGDFSLMVSASTFQWLSDPQHTFGRLNHHLQEKGWLIFSTFGTGNYKELRTITGNGLSYHSLSEMEALLSEAFEVIYSEEGHQVLYFDDPLQVLQHIKKTGVNAIPSQQSWTRGMIEDFVQKYAACFEVDGRVPLTYHPQYFVCRKRD